MASPLILCYNLNTIMESVIQGLCNKLKFRCRKVLPTEFMLPLGSLAGIPVSDVIRNVVHPVFDDPMLVMCNMLSPDLETFLKSLREEGIPAIPLKAILTPFNVTWDSIRLHDELVREREAMECNHTGQN